MTHLTYRLTAKNRDQLRNPTLGNRVWEYLYMHYYAQRVSAVAGVKERSENVITPPPIRERGVL